MAHIYAIRFTPGPTQLGEDECKRRLLKVITKYCGSWVLAVEDPGDNLHWQGWVRTDLDTPDKLRNNITNEFKREPASAVMGNKVLSVQTMKSTFEELQAYTMKGMNMVTRTFVLCFAQWFEYDEAYVKRMNVDTNWYDSKKKREPTQKHIVDEAVSWFSDSAGFADRTLQDKQKVVGQWLMDWIREHKMYPGNYIFANYINTTLLRLDRRYGDYLLDQVLQKL